MGRDDREGLILASVALLLAVLIVAALAAIFGSSVLLDSCDQVVDGDSACIAGGSHG